MRRITYVLVLCVLLARGSTAASFQGVEYQLPAGWKASAIDGALSIVPAQVDAATAIVVVLGPAEPLNGLTFRKWLDGQLTEELRDGSQVQQASEVKMQAANGLERATLVRVVSDTAGTVTLRMYHALSDGQRAALSAAVTASQDAATKHADTLQAFFESLRLTGAPHSTPPAAPIAPSPGVSIVGRWSTTDYFGDIVDPATGAFQADAYSGEWYNFRADGTYEYTIIASGQFISGASITSGSYEIRGSQLLLHQKQATWYPMPRSAASHPRYKNRPDAQETTLQVALDAAGALLVRDNSGSSETFHRQSEK